MTINYSIWVIMGMLLTKLFWCDDYITECAPHQLCIILYYRGSLYIFRCFDNSGFWGWHIRCHVKTYKHDRDGLQLPSRWERKTWMWPFCQQFCMVRLPLYANLSFCRFHKILIRLLARGESIYCRVTYGWVCNTSSFFYHFAFLHIYILTHHKYYNFKSYIYWRVVCMW